MKRAKQLARIGRVRAVQLGLARAAEVEARAHEASETALGDRIARLAAAIAPAPMAGGAGTLAAAAHYRERLQQSAFAARARVMRATDRAEAAADATRAAERDGKAVEKLRARADADAALAALRRSDGPLPARRTLRHDPC